MLRLDVISFVSEEYIKEAILTQFRVFRFFCFAKWYIDRRR